MTRHIRPGLPARAAAILLATLLAPAVQAQSEPPLWDAANAHYDPEAMAEARRALRHDAGGTRHFFVLADRLEWSDDDLAIWEAQGWYGGDLNRVWVKTDGAYDLDEALFEDASAELLYSRAATRFFDLQAGVRHDFDPDETRAVIGVEGLAPYWFEVGAQLNLGGEAGATAEFDAEYDVLFTQRLILQPSLETAYAFEAAPRQGLGDGFTDIEAALRLRYEVRRQFAPYVGVSWERALGDSADIAESAGEPVEETSLRIGLRVWF